MDPGLAQSAFVQKLCAMGCVTSGLSDLDAADLAVEAITRLCTDLGTPSHLSEVGAEEEDIPELADQCSKAGYEEWNPRLKI